MSAFSTEELMTIAIARELRNDDVAFVGLGTGGRAFTLAVGIPTAACQLARLTHAPGLSLMLGPIINPDPAYQPRNYSDANLIDWPSEAQITVEACLDCYPLGKITVSFVSGAQVDAHGNLNVVAIGDQRQPKVRLIGPIAQTDHLSAPARNIIVNHLGKRTFVENVDFISGAGYLDGPGAREAAGLPPQGPWRVLTDKAMFDFPGDDRRMAVKCLFPGSTTDDVSAGLSFEVSGLEDASVLSEPNDDELKVLREKVDPHGLLLGGGIQ